MNAPAELILASRSPYRRELLARLRLPFDVRAAEIDESPRQGEDPQALVRRLAEAKARAVEAKRGSFVIGSDQVAVLGGEVLGKPNGRDRAVEQLHAQAGRRVRFHTAVCLLDAGSDRADVAMETVTVRFRALTDDEIQRYLDSDRPYDCAGSFKSESLGVALCDAIETDDPTSLVGLPLIRLSGMLRDVGFELP